MASLPETAALGFTHVCTRLQSPHLNVVYGIDCGRCNQDIVRASSGQSRSN